MSPREESIMYASISEFNSSVPKRPPRRDKTYRFPYETWMGVYDRLYRELKPNQQFGKNFSRNFVSHKKRPPLVMP